MNHGWFKRAAVGSYSCYPNPQVLRYFRQALTVPQTLKVMAISWVSALYSDQQMPVGRQGDVFGCGGRNTELIIGC